ncbi:MAG: 4a-hydroxytetrahydrobiopterin dehydratase [Thiohalomonadales bacterium]
MSHLFDKSCKPCEKGGTALAHQESAELLSKIDSNWVISQQNDRLSRDFHFKNYYQTIAFVNSLAWIAHREDHHPDLEVGYNHCQVNYATHSIGGLSENDFICAAKIDALL